MLARAARALMCGAALATTLPPAWAQASVAESPGVRLPALGESAAEDFTVGTERRLGDQIMAEIRRDPAYLDDPVLLQYLQQVWQPLVEAARRRGDIEGDTAAQFAWESFLVRDRSVNAFALPGGFVGVHLGLIAMTATRDELASVLAHELTHVTQRHIARGIASQQRQTLLGVAGMILALLAASRSGNADMAQAALMGGQAAMIQGQLNFSRDMEREADRIGYALLGQAGFDSGGMAAMFEKLDGVNRLNDSNAYPYLRSHPLTLERQAEARLRLQGSAPPAQPARAGWLHALMGARSRVLMDPTTASLRKLQDPGPVRADQPAVERAAALYASSLASSLLRDHAVAERRGAELRSFAAAQSGSDADVARALWLLDAEGRLAAGDGGGARQQLARLRASGLGDGQERPLLLLQAQAALHPSPEGREDALRQMTEALQTWVTARPRDAAAWQLLGNCAEALGLRLRALRAQAEARWLLGDLNGALDRLRAGRNLARAPLTGQDFIESSIIDSRLRQLEGVRRQMQAEARGARGNGPRGETPPDEPPARDTPPREDTEPKRL
ncbi:MAG: M48 family metalloprotease [Rubrivivax sp.]